jgi:molybdopterin molybdotransferase
MDGYAVIAADIAAAPARLKIVGQAPAGGRYEASLARGEAVRIFTGAPLPDGEDSVVIQENTVRDGDWVVVNAAGTVGRHVRPAGLDFRVGEILIPADRRLTARHIGLAAAMNYPWLTVRRRPRVAILPTGDEIVLPGDPIGPNQIVSSNSLAIAALVATAGAQPIQLGIAADNADHLRSIAAGAATADLLVTSGGASVGEHDLVRDVLGAGGADLDFWKIAMRPGKPLMFGRFGVTPLIGLPGNPVSAIICAMLFVIPAIERLQGLADIPDMTEPAFAGVGLAANDERRDYLRAALRRGEDGRLLAFPAMPQDSSMMRALADADGLIVRAPHDPAVAAGAPLSVIRFPHGGLPI